MWHEPRSDKGDLRPRDSFDLLDESNRLVCELLESPRPGVLGGDVVSERERDVCRGVQDGSTAQQIPLGLTHSAQSSRLRGQLLLSKPSSPDLCSISSHDNSVVSGPDCPATRIGYVLTTM